MDRVPTEVTSPPRTRIGVALSVGAALLAVASCADETSIPSQAPHRGVVAPGGSAGSGNGGGSSTSGKTYLDPATGLRWEADPPSSGVSRSQAQQRCEALSLDGVSDYRLPTLGELRSLVTDCSATRAGGACGVTDQCLTSSCADLSCKGCDTLVCALPAALDGPCDVTWSSSTVQGASNKVWAIDFGTGQIGSLDATSDAVARCVSGSATTCQAGSSGTQVVSVSATTETPTKLYAAAGQTIQFTAKGTWCWGTGSSECSTADGTPGRPTSAELPVVVDGASFGTLSVRIGTQVVALGSSKTIKASGCGEIVLFMNDRPAFYGDNSGSLTVTIAFP